jgi:hypothetical protein
VTRESVAIADSDPTRRADLMPPPGTITIIGAIRMPDAS